MGFFRQEYWSGLPCPPPGDLPHPGMEPACPALQADSLLLSHRGREFKKQGYLLKHMMTLRLTMAMRNYWRILRQQSGKIRIYEIRCKTGHGKLRYRLEDLLQSKKSLRVWHDWATSLWLFTFMHWRRKWQPTPLFLPGESQGRGSLVGCRLWGHTESDTTEAT